MRVHTLFLNGQALEEGAKQVVGLEHLTPTLSSLYLFFMFEIVKKNNCFNFFQDYPWCKSSNSEGIENFHFQRRKH